MICPYCNKKAKFCENKEIYGKNYGKSYMVYYCKDCDAYVGCHNNSDKPLGTMANKELRKWRRKTHSILDPLWKTGKITRKELYFKISKYFKKEIHIGSSDIEQCNKIIKFLGGENYGKI